MQAGSMVHALNSVVQTELLQVRPCPPHAGRGPGAAPDQPRTQPHRHPLYDGPARPHPQHGRRRVEDAVVHRRTTAWDVVEGTTATLAKLTFYKRAWSTHPLPALELVGPDGAAVPEAIAAQSVRRTAAAAGAAGPFGWGAGANGGAGKGGAGAGASTAAPLPTPVVLMTPLAPSGSMPAASTGAGMPFLPSLGAPVTLARKAPVRTDILRSEGLKRLTESKSAQRYLNRWSVLLLVMDMICYALFMAFVFSAVPSDVPNFAFGSVVLVLLVLRSGFYWALTMRLHRTLEEAVRRTGDGRFRSSILAPQLHLAGLGSCWVIGLADVLSIVVIVWSFVPQIQAGVQVFASLAMLFQLCSVTWSFRFIAPGEILVFRQSLVSRQLSRRFVILFLAIFSMAAVLWEAYRRNDGYCLPFEEVNDEFHVYFLHVRDLVRLMFGEMDIFKCYTDPLPDADRTPLEIWGKRVLPALYVSLFLMVLTMFMAAIFQFFWAERWRIAYEEGKMDVYTREHEFYIFLLTKPIADALGWTSFHKSDVGILYRSAPLHRAPRRASRPTVS